MRILCEDDGLEVVKEKGPFESEVHNVQMLQIPDVAAMQSKSLVVPKAMKEQVVPVKIITLLLLNTADGALLWADASKCRVI